MNPRRVSPRAVCLATVFLSVAILAAPAAAEAPPEYLRSWGSRGSGPGEFYHPSAVLVAPGGSVFVADLGNSRIQRFTPDGVFVSQWSVLDPSDPRFEYPRSLVMDAAGDLYSIDCGHGRVHRYAPNGTLQAAWGDSGTAVGQLWELCGIAIGKDGNVYLACSFNGIQEFTPDGTFIRQFNRLTPDGRTYQPVHLAMDQAGNVYATDCLSNTDRVIVFTADGDYLREWGSRGAGDGEFADANGIAVDSLGNVYVTERDMWSMGTWPPVADNRVQKFTNSGVFLDQWGGNGTGPGEFNWPEDVAPAPGGIVYVADVYNNRIQAFGPPGVPVQVPSTPMVTALRSVDPNPAGSTVRVVYDLARAGRVELSVLDITGRRVRTLLDGAAGPGAGQVSWDGCASDGRRVAAGIYFVRLAADGRQMSRRVALTR
ncbi:MAG TPA: FlgD immunoglobulin-like domain containing protein [Candidatus Saccharimonadales bacterium]|nr:FlgD immunoglobulin-like domain containing protein [Candidatus Saccharimonadales bacterium]